MNSFMKFNNIILSSKTCIHKRMKKIWHCSISQNYEYIFRSFQANICTPFIHERDFSTHSEQKASRLSSLPSNQKLSDITHDEYAQRRYRLMDLLCKQTSKARHIIIMPGSPRRYMIDKIPYLYRQDTDMLYLSGCKEQNCVLVIHSIPNGKPHNHKSIMFTPPYDPSKELWDGPHTYDIKAPSKWGVDQGLPITELLNYLKSIEKELSNPELWYHYLTPPNSETHTILDKWLLKEKLCRLTSPKQYIHLLRCIKSPAEIKLMRQACQISAESIGATMQHCTSPISEHELFATVDYHCRMKGADYLAYPPVVAGGHRANIIHYIQNNQTINPGELVLMDAGGEYKGYSGDVTRTWPINGKFSPAQRDLYEAVLEVQKYLIAQCMKRRPSLDELFVLMCQKLGLVLQEIGLIPKDIPQSQISRAAYGFCPHHVSHYLGMDVHDTPLVKKSEPLATGSIITIEPGVYVNKMNVSVPSHFAGLGVRIEDDVLITETGVEVLSKACPKHPDEIEAIVGSAL